MKTLSPQKNTCIAGGAPERERGVALLFVILLTSVLLVVALGIANIAYKEGTFSLEARDSAHAFFAADTGIECGLYLDIKEDLFGGTGTASPVCHGDPIVIGSGGGSIYTFTVPIQNCVQVTVDKDYMYDNGDGTGPQSYTQISAVGYNIPADPTIPGTCLSGAPGPRVVTRALLTRYLNTP